MTFKTSVKIRIHHLYSLFESAAVPEPCFRREGSCISLEPVNKSLVDKSLQVTSLTGAKLQKTD